MNSILNGVVDLHIHAGPSVAERSVDVAEMLALAEEHQYKAFVVKDHYFPTMFSTNITRKHLSKTVEIFGGICLNNSVGVFNLNAVDAAYNMGAKFVCMPTVSSKRHIESHQGKHFAGSGDMSIPEKPVYYLNDEGGLIPEVNDLLDYLASKQNLILYTGHGSAREVDVLIRQALKTGVRKILVNHPFFTVNASIEQITQWSKLGAYIELCGSIFRKPEPAVTLGEILKNVPPEQLVLDTDSGQKGGTSPVDRLLNNIKVLIEEHNVSEKNISMMMKETPSMLLEI